MAIIILLICFVTLFFSIGILLNPVNGRKELILQTVIVFCGLVVLITELLSLFRALNFQSILLSWSALTMVNLIYLYANKIRFKVFSNHLKQQLFKAFQKSKTIKLYEKCLLFSVLIILVLVFLQGIVYPPNNWDSMNYHMGRIPSWIAHQSVAHYPTGAIRQIYQPPFTEYIIMHFNILNRADYFSSAAQFLCLLFSIVALVAITETFGLALIYKIITIFLALTIPEVILQAASTQNDIVVAFFVIVAFYFAIKSIEKFSAGNAFFFGLSVGLGILTKGTAYVYMPTILLIFGITLAVRVFTSKNYKYLLFAILAGFMFLAINFGFYYRNYHLTSNLLGVDEKEYRTYSNEKMSAKLLFSNVIKNAGNHIGLLHLKPLSVLTARSILKLHQIIGVDINDPANNYYKDKYDTLYNPDHEDAAPNFVHFILISAGLFVVIIQTFKRKIPLPVKLLVFTLIFQGLFFCFYLKYQPFHTRLQTTLFLLSVPVICYAVRLVNLGLKKLFYWSTPFIFVYALMIVLGNLNHPYNSAIMKNRYQKYFIAKPWLYDDYQRVTNNIQTSNYKKIGLLMGDGDADFEYTLFTDCYSTTRNPVYINVENYTNKAQRFDAEIDCIISTINNNPYLDYQGKRFYNQAPKNQFIHLYK